MAQYSLFVLKVPLNPKQANKQTNFLCTIKRSLSVVVVVVVVVVVAVVVVVVVVIVIVVVVVVVYRW